MIPFVAARHTLLLQASKTPGRLPSGNFLGTFSFFIADYWLSNKHILVCRDKQEIDLSIGDWVDGLQKTVMLPQKSRLA